MSVTTEFPDFDAALPDIAGFEDTSYHHDVCPSLTNSELGLQLFVDYADPDLSEYPEARRSGELTRFRLMPAPGSSVDLDLEANSDDLGEILAAIAKVKNTTNFAP